MFNCVTVQRDVLFPSLRTPHESTVLKHALYLNKDLPRLSLADPPLVLGLLVVQLIVAGVSASGSGCNHSSGLRLGESCCRRRCVVSWTYREKQRKSLCVISVGASSGALVLEEKSQ